MLISDPQVVLADNTRLRDSSSSGSCRPIKAARFCSKTVLFRQMKRVTAHRMHGHKTSAYENPEMIPGQLSQIP